jgi:hypothetical protein
MRPIPGRCFPIRKNCPSSSLRSHSHWPNADRRQAPASCRWPGGSWRELVMAGGVCGWGRLGCVDGGRGLFDWGRDIRRRFRGTPMGCGGGRQQYSGYKKKIRNVMFFMLNTKGRIQPASRLSHNCSCPLNSPISAMEQYAQYICQYQSSMSNAYKSFQNKGPAMTFFC